MLVNLLENKVEWFPVLFETPEQIFHSVAFWLAIALAVAFVVCLFAIKGNNRAKLLKIGGFVTVAYACAVMIASLVFWITDANANGEFLPILFIPIAALVVVIVVCSVLMLKLRAKAVKTVCGVCIGVAVIVAFVCIGIHYGVGDSLEMNWIQNPENVKSAALYVCAILAMVIVLAVAFLCDKRRFSFDTKSLSYAGMCVAMSFALSYLRLAKMPQGGSITVASLLPLMIYSYMFGMKKGVFAGCVYGLLQAVQDPYIIHPAQFVLDYPAAFACIGLAGMFANSAKLEKLPQIKFALGAVVAGLSRLVMHFLSGVFAFGEFAPAGQNVAVYSILYQMGYVLPDIAIVIVIGVLVFTSKAFVKMVDGYRLKTEFAK